jgi:S1-C subfamily serine protease
VTRNRTEYGVLVAAVLASLLLGALAGGVFGGGVAFWLVNHRPAATAAPSPVANVIRTPSPMPAAPTEPSVPAAPRTTATPAGVITLREESALTDVVAKVGSSVVTVVNQGQTQRDMFGNLRQAESLGSGVLIAPEGYLITNNHVVEGNASLSVITSDGKQYDAQVVGADSLSDLAVLKVNGDLGVPGVPLGDSDQLLAGQRVVAIGSALGEFKNTVTSGIISGLNRSLDTDAGFRMEGLIQTDAAINHGNSGGPLVNLQGQVIGINAMIIRSSGTSTDVAEGIGFAIASNTVRTIAAELIRNGKMSRPYLGITQQDLSAGLARYYGLSVDHGALVLRVVRRSPAEQAGMQPGDVLTAINDQEIDADHPYLNVLVSQKAGQKVALTVNRSGRTLKLETVLGEQ